MTDSLVFGESELVASKEVGDKESSGAAGGLIFIGGAALDGELLDALAEEEDCDEAHVHHPEVHGAGLLEAEGAVLVEDTHGHAGNFSQNHLRLIIIIRLSKIIKSKL